MNPPRNPGPGSDFGRGRRKGFVSIFVLATLTVILLLLAASSRMVRDMRREVDLTDRRQRRHLAAPIPRVATNAPATPTPPSAIELESSKP